MIGKRFSMFALLVIVSLLVASCGAEATPTAAPAPATATTAPVAAPTDTTAPVAAPTDTTAPVAAATNTTAPVAAATATTGGTSGGSATLQTMDWSKVGQEMVDAMAGKYKGTKVTVFGPFVGDDETKFNNSNKDFTTATGITIAYEGSKEFETTINVRVEGGKPPDIADFPQPGLMASVAKTGKIIDASKMVSMDWL
jgi:alpha-glucoside transport system substrate-binding protein